VWLDRGELDKIVERASRYVDRDDDDIRQPQPTQPEYRRQRADYGDDRYYRKRKSFWSELFD
jgi:Zn-finger nucleic acid-binding protein